MSFEVKRPSFSLFVSTVANFFRLFIYFIYETDPPAPSLFISSSTTAPASWSVVRFCWFLAVLVKNAGKVGWLLAVLRVMSAVVALFEVRLVLVYLPPPPIAFRSTSAGGWGLGTLTHCTCWPWCYCRRGEPSIAPARPPFGLRSTYKSSPLSIIPRITWSFRWW